MRRLATLASFLTLTGAAQAQEPSDKATRTPAPPSPEPPFLCDSVVAQDCFDMYQRYRAGRERAVKNPDAAKTAPSSDNLDWPRPRDDTAK